MEGEEFKYCYSLAIQGSVDRQFELGDCYYYGYGIERDIKQAIYWY
jgi:TPR repeat protein